MKRIAPVWNVALGHPSGGVDRDVGRKLERVVCSGHIKVGMVNVWPHSSLEYCARTEGGDSWWKPQKHQWLGMDRGRNGERGPRGEEEH